jgi:hypothetical protein
VTTACQPAAEPAAIDAPAGTDTATLLDKYTTVRLTTDLPLSDNQKSMIPLLIDAAAEMETVFWQQAYGDKQAALALANGDPELERFININYGPWDRLDGNRPFISGVSAKPLGANLYPADATKEEIEQAVAAAQAAGNDALAEQLTGLYALVRRADDGSLETVPYSQAFAEPFTRAADKLRQAADLADNAALETYLRLRADALLSDDYYESDLAWMSMKDNTLDFVVGPIETYEDQLFGYKAGAEAYVLIKDQEWSSRLARYATFLPELQAGLPVPDQYKAELPGTDSELNAYDVVYYAGEANAGSKTIAINLPNDERVQQLRGTRRLQLKNAVRAKFDKILLPISDMLIDESQRQFVDFDAFFGNTMFHEVAHGLGIKQTLDGTSTVRQALQEQASAIEEGKADVLGLYMVTQLHARGEITDTTLEQNYVTFIASIFRSIRFGASSAHGKANLLRFNFFEELGAFTRNSETGTYRVELDKMEQAVNALSERILTFQGNGDYDGVSAFVAQYGQIDDQLAADLERLAAAGIPVDIVFEQGASVLGL